MEKEKNGPMFGKVLAFIVIVGLAIYYFGNKKNDPNIEEIQPVNETTDESQGVTNEAELEAEIETFDSDLSDMQEEDMDI